MTSQHRRRKGGKAGTTGHTDSRRRKLPVRRHEPDTSCFSRCAGVRCHVGDRHPGWTGHGLSGRNHDSFHRGVDQAQIG